MSEKIDVLETYIDKNTPEKFFKDGVSVAASAFGLPQTPEFELDVYNHLLNHQTLFAYDECGAPVGFSSLEYLTAESKGILYISGLVVKKEYQGKGTGTFLATEAIAKIRESKPVDLIAGRTQNPVVAKTRMNYCHPVYPINASPDPDIILAAQALHSHLKMDSPLDPITLVTKNAYESPMYINRPLSGRPEIDSFFAKNVGPRDAVFIIGRPAF